MIGGSGIIHLAQRCAGAMGYRLWIQKRRADWDPILVDRFQMLAYHTPSPGRQLYIKALQQSHADPRLDNFSRQSRFDALVQVAAWAIRRNPALPIAECGCFRGQSSYMLASVQRAEGGTGVFHVFDSFEGLSPLGPDDADARTPLSPEERSTVARSLAASEDHVARVLAEFPRVRLHRGWIPERFHEVADETFSFVHVDVDLYQPTRDAFEFFWPRLASRGIIVCDDYGLTQFPGATKAVDQWRDQAEFFFATPLGGCFLRKP